MATIPAVAPLELIESSWGNLVATELNTRVLKLTGGALTGNLTAPAFIAGQSPNAATSTPGGILQTNGQLTTTLTTNVPNVSLTRVGAQADVPAQQFIRFGRSVGNTIVGSVSLVDGSTIIYNTTSDERLKDELGPVPDALERLRALRPIRYAWTATGVERDGFLAHEVDEVVPGAVVGERGAVLPDDDPNDPGGIDPQMLDVSQLVPLLTAALQAALEDVESLTGRVAALEAAPTATGGGS